VDEVGIPQLRAQGLDGSGITIAILDTEVDDSVPELVGVDIEHRNPCGFEYYDKSYGTMVASILASPDYGWVPNAKIISYAVDEYSVGGQVGLQAESAVCKAGKGSVGAFLNQALNDGADIINITKGGVFQDAMSGVIRAADMGVPVIVSAGDYATRVSDFAAMSYTVGVGAVGGSPEMEDDPERYDGVSITAYGGPSVMNRLPDGSGNLTRIETHYQSNSIATTMVTGALALAMQRWPDANGNQLIRAMTDTADHVEDSTAPMGEAMVLNASRLIAADPSGYSDTNPYTEKTINGEPSQPTAKEVKDYRDGVMDPEFAVADEDYVYRGCDESVIDSIEFGRYPGLKTDLYSASGCEGLKPLEATDVYGSKWIAGVLGGYGGLLLVGLIVGFIVRPRPRPSAGHPDGQPPATPNQPAQHPGAAAYPPGQYPPPVPNQYPPPRSGQFPPYPSRYPAQSEKE
jgi:hypothetical protein